MTASSVPDTRAQPSDFIRDAAWQQRFDEEVLAAAKTLASKTKELKLDEPVEGSYSLQAKVAGEDTEVSFWLNGSSWEIESFCSCDLGSFCHHAAGLMMKAAKQGDLTRLQGMSVNSAVQQAIEEQKAEATAAAKAKLPHISAEPTFELHIVREPVDRTSKLLLQSLGQPDPDVWIFAEATVNYAGHRSPLRSAMPDWSSEVIQADGSRVILDHNKAVENQAARQLTDTGLSSLQSNSAWRFLLNRKSRDAKKFADRDRWFPDPSRIPAELFWHQFRGEWVEKLEAQGWDIQIDDNVGHAVHDAAPDNWNTELIPTSGGWFSLSVGFDVSGERHDLLPILAELLEANILEETLDRPNHGFIYAPLPNGDALKLPIGRIRRILDHLASLIDPKFPDRTKLHALDAAALAQLEGLGMEVPPDLNELTTKLETFDGIEPVDPNPNVQATLRDYQLAGFRWMQFLARHGLHGILADDMGLGKTLQTLTHIQAEKSSGFSKGRPTLVVAPTSVVPNWYAEAQKFTPDLRVLILSGPKRKSYFRSIPHADVVLTSFALLHRDIKHLGDYEFHLVVLDEAQNIKNPHAKVAQAACKLQAHHRLCLSGTPVENHLGELWSLMKFLIPGFLGSEEAFDQQYRKPIEKDGNDERNTMLKERVAPLILRRTKDQVATELPPKTEIIHRIELHTEQKDLYETVRATMNKRVRQAMAARGGNEYQIVFLDALLKLRQICCDPRLLPDDYASTVEASAKLDFLTDLLDVLIEEGRRILIFSQFTTMLSLIEEHLKSKQIDHLKLTGASKDRGKLVEDFQSGRVPLFLISLKAGGTGLNLTAADTVIHFDPWWNPAAEAQATDRAYRIGQDKPVFVHKLLCEDTVEERIHKMQQEKAKLAQGLLADADITRRLDPAMVKALLD